MEKEFNVTGLCVPTKHYMVDISAKLDGAMRLIGKGKYFAINRPRQFGKTTILNALAQHMLSQPDKYILAQLSFEGVGDAIFVNETSFCPGFVKNFAAALVQDNPVEAAIATELGHGVDSMDALSVFITQFVRRCGREVVVLIDEVDKASNNQLFLSFLGMLRNKYLAREAGRDATFHAVVLAGVHDIKTLKLKIRPGAEAKLNSPWNIASDFNVDLSFSSAEIKTMLEEYAADKPVTMDFNAIAERLRYYTSGHPFLVSSLCKILDEEASSLNPAFDPKHWTTDDIDWAFRRLTSESYTNANFDDLTKNLENHPTLYHVVSSVVFGTEEDAMSYSPKDPVVNLGILFGMFRNDHGRVAIHNRVYEQIIADYMRLRLKTSGKGYLIKGVAGNFAAADGKLDMAKILLKFQEFMKEHYSSRDAAFLEREGRLVFLSFLKPIVNGSGFLWKEPVIGDERRMDVVVTYGAAQKEVVELKVWRGEEYHQRGLVQLSEYLDFQNLDHGFLLLFDFNKGKEYKSESIDSQGKSLFAVWV